MFFKPPFNPSLLVTDFTSKLGIFGTKPGYLFSIKGKSNEALKFFKQSLELETDTYKKSKKSYKIGLILKKKGSYGQARTYFNQALKLNPSNGNPHLAIAAMYNSSANNWQNNTQ